jgi:hypothetical protein
VLHDPGAPLHTCWPLSPTPAPSLRLDSSIMTRSLISRSPSPLTTLWARGVRFPCFRTDHWALLVLRA